jgi:hypothetical protein
MRKKFKDFETQSRYYSGFVLATVFSKQILAISPEAIIRHSRSKPGGFREVQEKQDWQDIPSFKLYIENASEPSVTVLSYSEYMLRGPLNNDYFRNNIPHVIYNLGEQVRQESLSMVTAHASAVLSPSGQAYLILGNKGMGKTSVALALCVSCGYQLIGEDTVLIQFKENKINVCGGAKMCFVRPNIFHCLFPVFGENPDYENVFEKRFSLYPPDYRLRIAEDAVYPLGSVVSVNIHPANNMPTSYPISLRIKEFYRLRENTSRYIRGMVTVLLSDANSASGVFPSLDTTELERMRNKMINCLLNEHIFCYVYGSDIFALAKYLDTTSFGLNNTT